MDKFTIVRDGMAVQRVQTAAQVKYYLAIWRECYPGSSFDVDPIED